MAIDYRALRSLTARRLINALVRDGFVLDRQAGAHQHYFHRDDHRRVTVSFHHSGQTFAPKILKVMIELQARWSKADLRRLKLLK
ncbi:MAG: HicA toxin of bacterial toxin-antitoxin [Geminicoccaceae bacterium]|jgi:predicted RNA binding protein YcfA (HicA-like mRNA interferase family)|nr:HicA toxin of bacterial toxin-antitoxin [Geminicoccaceae bacterium]MDF2782124.1 HicA toxin of bacterial toxin-antitoxin [Geminicoccaceae bacterium]